MGAIEVSLSNPDIVYTGTGSSKIRSNVSIGRGISESTDAGHTWTFASLSNPAISTIRVNPGNPDVLYVAALGNPFVPNKERGVCTLHRSRQTKPGNQTLFLSDTLGAADLELQPGNPKVIFACMWHGQRKPWTIVSGALEGGVSEEHRWRRRFGPSSRGWPAARAARTRQRGDFGSRSASTRSSRPSPAPACTA